MLVRVRLGCGVSWFVLVFDVIWVFGKFLVRLMLCLINFSDVV